MPEIIYGIELRGTRIEPQPQLVEGESCSAENSEGERFVPTRPPAENQETDGQARE